MNRRGGASSNYVACPSCGVSSAGFIRSCSYCGSSLLAQPRNSNRTTPQAEVTNRHLVATPQPANAPIIDPTALFQQPEAPSQNEYQNYRNTSEAGVATVSYNPTQLAEFAALADSARKYGDDLVSSVREIAKQLDAKKEECARLREYLDFDKSSLVGVKTNTPWNIDSPESAAALQQITHSHSERLNAAASCLVIETPQEVQYKKLSAEFETVRKERSLLQVDLVSLRALVSELRRIPAPTSDTALLAETGRKSRNPRDDDQLEARRQLNTSVSSWNVVTQPSALVVPEQRDLMNCLLYLANDDAKPLVQSGVLNVIRVIARRLTMSLPNGTHAELGVVLGEVLREIRRGTDFLDEALLPISVAEVSITEKITNLFLANNPNCFMELQKLITGYEGKWEELYSLLRKEYCDTTGLPQFAEDTAHASDDKLYTQPSAVSFRQSQLAKAGSFQITPQNRTITLDQREIHARCVIMYKKYNPAKANSLDFLEMLRKYSPEVILVALVEKYGPEPTLTERRALIKEIFDDSATTSGTRLGGGTAPSIAAGAAGLNTSSSSAALLPSPSAMSRIGSGSSLTAAAASK